MTGVSPTGAILAGPHVTPSASVPGTEHPAFPICYTTE